MKKILLSFLVAMGALTTQAADYPYLTFETTDGAKTSVTVSSLTLTISGTTLTAGSQSFTLSNLKKMYFSTSDETTTGIQPLLDTTNDVSAIYDLKGNKVEKSQMKKGAYIVKTKQGTHKLVVK